VFSVFIITPKILERCLADKYEQFSLSFEIFKYHMSRELKVKKENVYKSVHMYCINDHFLT